MRKNKIYSGLVKRYIIHILTSKIFCLLEFILKDWEYNYAQIIMNYINEIDNETIKDFGGFLNAGIVTVIIKVSMTIKKMVV